MLILWRWPEVGGDVVVLLVRMLALVMMLVCVVEGKMAWLVEGLDGGCVTGSPGYV